MNDTEPTIYTAGAFTVSRFGSRDPSEYRLARLATGELVLQGRMDWRECDAKGAWSFGHEWETLPTVDIP